MQSAKALADENSRPKIRIALNARGMAQSFYKVAQLTLRSDHTPALPSNPYGCRNDYCGPDDESGFNCLIHFVSPSVVLVGA